MIEIVKLLTAVFLGIGLTWLWDRLLVRAGVNERLRIGIVIPVSEEIVKLAGFYWLKLPPVLFNGLFGLGEGFLESLSVSKRLIITVLVAGCLTHIIFSLFYLTALARYLQLLLAIGAHILWNYRVLNRAG